MSAVISYFCIVLFYIIDDCFRNSHCLHFLFSTIFRMLKHIVRIWLVFTLTTRRLGFCTVYTFTGLFQANWAPLLSKGTITPLALVACKNNSDSRGSVKRFLSLVFHRTALPRHKIDHLKWPLNWPR